MAADLARAVATPCEIVTDQWRRQAARSVASIRGDQGLATRTAARDGDRSGAQSIRMQNESRIQRILTARAARSASTVSEMIDWTIIRTFPHRAKTGVSVGEKAVLVLNARNK